MKKFLLIILSYFVFSFVSLNFVSAASDLLENAVEDAKQYDNVVDMWANSTAVWNRFFWGWDAVTGKGVVTKEPIIIKFTKFLLRLTVAVWITMFLIWWTMFLLSMWDDWKMKKARNNLIMAWVWIVLALASLWIIELIRSLANTIVTN